MHMSAEKSSCRYMDAMCLLWATVIMDWGHGVDEQSAEDS